MKCDGCGKKVKVGEEAVEISFGEIEVDPDTKETYIPCSEIAWWGHKKCFPKELPALNGECDK